MRVYLINSADYCSYELNCPFFHQQSHSLLLNVNNKKTTTQELKNSEG